VSVIAILDDDPGRIQAMVELLQARCGSFALRLIDNAPEMIDWLKRHLHETRLICLDHDLGPNRQTNGTVFDPGTGRDVADFLATLNPVCPVIIHTTNTLAAPGMQMVLEDAGWSFSQVSPFGDLEWIRFDWIAEVERVLNRA
jgi:hypothetical protein